jgi:hypothetical protein
LNKRSHCGTSQQTVGLDDLYPPLENDGKIHPFITSKHLLHSPKLMDKMDELKRSMSSQI